MELCLPNPIWTTSLLNGRKGRFNQSPFPYLIFPPSVRSVVTQLTAVRPGRKNVLKYTAILDGNNIIGSNRL